MNIHEPLAFADAVDVDFNSNFMQSRGELIGNYGSPEEIFAMPCFFVRTRNFLVYRPDNKVPSQDKKLAFSGKENQVGANIPSGLAGGSHARSLSMLILIIVKKIFSLNSSLMDDTTLV
jgi:hypothetical protein